MGLSGSQARLLYLTAQINNLSFKGQNVSDAKTRLAMDTQEAQNKYIEALNSSRLYLNTNIFSSDGAVTQTEYISIANLQASGYMVSDGSKLLGYTWEQVETGDTEWLPTGEYEDDLTKPIYENWNTAVNNFSAADPNAIGDINTMTDIVDSLGLSTDDLEVQSYLANINGNQVNLNAIAIKSQEGFEAVYEMLQEQSQNGNTNNALNQNYVLNLASIDLSKYSNTEISQFNGIFDGNGATPYNEDGTQALFNDGTVINTNPENITPIGYEKKAVYIEVPKCEYKLVEDPSFSISSLALEEGLRSGAYTLVQQSDTSTTETITLNGLYFNTVDLNSCSMITDETDEDAVAKAEAEFNREMAEIQIQDKRYEMDQKKIDTQYQAYLAEEESLKTALSKNIEHSYKTFSG